MCVLRLFWVRYLVLSVDMSFCVVFATRTRARVGLVCVVPNFVNLSFVFIYQVCA